MTSRSSGAGLLLVLTLLKYLSEWQTKSDKPVLLATDGR